MEEGEDERHVRGSLPQPAHHVGALPPVERRAEDVDGFEAACAQVGVHLPGGEPGVPPDVLERRGEGHVGEDPPEELLAGAPVGPEERPPGVGERGLQRTLEKP